MTYIDTSCLLKLVRVEEGRSQAVADAIGQERSVDVSELALLESLIQLKSGYQGGSYSLSRFKQMETRLGSLLKCQPFAVKTLSIELWPIAFRQHRAPGGIYCRSLDRLHLAAMELLGSGRLMTHDLQQARAAEALGYEVHLPGIE